MHWIKPRDKAGLRIFEASALPSVPPAPIIVWISSMNKIILPASSISVIIFFNLSSNSPRYLVPASNVPISSTITLLPSKLLGTFWDTILSAKPSTIAVLPTPGSPINTGLFLVLLFKISIIRVISLSRANTGSNLLLKASLVKSLAKEFSVLVFVEFSSDASNFLNPSNNLDNKPWLCFNNSNNSEISASIFIPNLSVNKRTAVPVFSLSKDNNKCSLVTTKLEVSSANCWLFSIVRTAPFV